MQLEEIQLSSSSDDEVSKESSPDQPLWQLLFFLLLWQSIYRVSNTAVNVLLKFLSIFIRVFGGAFAGNRLQQFSEIPLSTVAAHKILWNTKQVNFIEYVVCPSCHSIYEYDKCYITRHGQKESKLCSHVAYPSHPHCSKRKACEATLLRKVWSARCYKLVPNKIYSYQPLHMSLTRIVQKEGFLDACEKWRNRFSIIPDQHLGDIYDGRVWSDFQSCAFLEAPFCYLLQLNVDWFQPLAMCNILLVQYI